METFFGCRSDWIRMIRFGWWEFFSPRHFTWKCLGSPDKTRSLAKTSPRWPSTTLPSANGISALAVDIWLFCHAGTAVSWCTKGVIDIDGDQLHEYRLLERMNFHPFLSGFWRCVKGQTPSRASDANTFPRSVRLIGLDSWSQATTKSLKVLPVVKWQKMLFPHFLGALKHLQTMLNFTCILKKKAFCIVCMMYRDKMWGNNRWFVCTWFP